MEYPPPPNCRRRLAFVKRFLFFVFFFSFFLSVKRFSLGISGLAGGGVFFPCFFFGSYE